MRVRVNGFDVTVNPIWRDRCLLEYLREELDLKGAKNGCDVGACGSCTVLVSGRPKQACRMRVGEVAGRELVTIEGMESADGTLHPLQQAFIDQGAIQCGFCTPGMVLRAHGLLLANPRPTRGEIRKAISPNLCRCTGYQQIIDAIETAAGAYPAPDGKEDA